MITFGRLGRHGQLGNQLFQYAMLLGVSAKTGFEVKIPKNFQAKKKAGLCELDRMRISAKNLKTFDRRFLTNQYHEKGFSFDPDVWKQPDGTDYAGYYQTEKYFAHIDDWVRREYTFVDPLIEYADTYIQDRRTCDCIIAIHVRRGDYKDNPDLFHILGMEYYDRAIKNKVFPDGRQYFIFSDDIDWCKANFLWDQVTFVNSPSHWHDLTIMSKCDAHIISASSFSWWAAWLSNSRMVVAPSTWFPLNGPRGGYNFSDIVPARWEKQDV